MPSVRRFSTQHDCARAIASVYRSVESGECDPQKGRVLIYAALSVSQILGGQPLMDRIERLETTIQKRGAA
jgi:hypothetical protein